MHDTETIPTAMETQLHRFRNLPGTVDDFFCHLWEEHRLRYTGPEQLDLCDELSARLAVAAIHARRCILIAFPDSQIHRAAVLFATVLLRFWWNTRQQNRPTRVLYFGSHIGIRDQLGAVKVANLSVDLGTIFEETHLSRHDTGHVVAELGTSSLPRVVTVYSPADTVAVFAALPPDLIAIDVGVGKDARWFTDVIGYAKAHGVPLVAWGENPLSGIFREFSSIGEVFTWPPQRRSEVLLDPNILFRTSLQPVTPIMPIGADAELYSDLLRKATKLLASSRAPGRLAEHALATHWQYVRNLELLHIPVEIYEAEALQYWGLRPLAHIRRACQQFQETCWQSTPTFASALQAASALLDQALTAARATEPPLWRLLATICVEGPPDGSVPRPDSSRAPHGGMRSLLPATTHKLRRKRIGRAIAALARLVLADDQLAFDRHNNWSAESIRRCKTLAGAFTR